MEEKEYRLNPMLPRRFNSRQRAEIRQKEKEIIEEATKKIELKEKRKKEICSNTDYNNSQEYYYGCSISDDAKRHSNYCEFELEDVIKFHTDNKDNVKVLQKQNIYKTR